MKTFAICFLNLVYFGSSKKGVLVLRRFAMRIQQSDVSNVLKKAEANMNTEFYAKDVQLRSYRTTSPHLGDHTASCSNEFWIHCRLQQITILIYVSNFCAKIKTNKQCKGWFKSIKCIKTKKFQRLLSFVEFAADLLSNRNFREIYNT